MDAALVDFYRVAHPEYSYYETDRPQGPYRSGGTFNLALLAERLSEAHSDGEHPVPLMDGIGWIEMSEVCGFATVEALEEWFDGWLDELDAAGYRRYHYRLPEERVRKGMRQVVAYVGTEPVAVESLL